MDSLLIAAGTAAWLGILTSISPCPLATNIAAISYLGKQISRPGYVVWSGLAYTLGRTLVYLGLGIIIVAGLLNIPALSFFLQENINKILGPVLILTGIFLLEIIPLRLPGFSVSTATQNRLASRGHWGAFILGFLFALSFCPVSAGLFFGSLIPLAVKENSQFAMPAIYGIGTALPVIIFAVVVSLATGAVGKIFDKLTIYERWARRLTGLIFIAVGIYLCLKYIFAVLD